MNDASSTEHAPTASRLNGPRFVLIGGFFGSGKTAAAARLGALLRQRGKRPAFITNDAGSANVDTLILRAMGFPSEHVGNGPFAAQFDSLTKAAARLVDSAQTDIIIAESIGSSADLFATVANPLQRTNDFALAPLTVVVDSTAEVERRFTGKVQYLHRKQTEEADIILLSKTDSAPASALEALSNRLGAEFHAANIIEASARTGAGIEKWADALLNPVRAKTGSFQIDCEACSDGESLLGSLNCALQLSALRGFEANPILGHLAEAIQTRLAQGRIEIAHLKMALSPEVDMDGVATLNVVGDRIDIGEELAEPVERASLSISLRAEAKPDALYAAITDALTHVWMARPNIFARLTLMEHFRPARPHFVGKNG